MCMHRPTHWVQGATECRAVGVRLQERGHPKRRLLLSLFNRWLDRLFEGSFNCRGDGALKTSRLFSPLLLISPLMTPIKNTHTPICAALFIPRSPFFFLPVTHTLSLPLLLISFFILSPHFITLDLIYSRLYPDLQSQCVYRLCLPINVKTGASS